MISERKLYEIELGITKLDDYNICRNLIVCNVNGVSMVLPLDHECDMLICSKSGYLTEIEIKRSWEDFKADFKKASGHNCCGVISNFFYCVSELFADRAIDYLEENEIDCNGVLVYNEKGPLVFRRYMLPISQCSEERWKARKLFMEQRLYLAKLGAMRQFHLKEKLLGDVSNLKCMRNYTTKYEKIDKKA